MNGTLRDWKAKYKPYHDGLLKTELHLELFIFLSVRYDFLLPLFFIVFFLMILGEKSKVCSSSEN